jgi:YesN/AraC family two-component response regulator
LVMTDIIMPDMEGIETILGLRRSHPRLRIIAMSGGGRGSAHDYLLVAQQLGATRVLAKPFSTDEMKNTIAAVLAAD